MSTQKIFTDDVRTRIEELNAVIQKNIDMGQAVMNGINAMNSGVTQNMQYNMMDKTLTVSRSLVTILQCLNQGKTTLGQVVSAYESTDASLKKGVEDWVGDTPVLSSNIALQPNMGSFSMDQDSYHMMYDGYNAGCMSTAYAIGQSIVTGQPQDPMHFWNEATKQANCREAKVTDKITSDLDSIYEGLANGKPTLLHFTHQETGTQHWVVISGVNNASTTLNYSNFTAIDPLDGKTKNLQDLLNEYKGSNVDYMRQFK